MNTWFKQQLANVAGTQEPIYGPSAIKPVDTQSEVTPWTELNSDQLKWRTMDSTCVETLTFYITADNGLYALAQIIYSNVAGIRITCQFSSKVFFQDNRPHIFTTNRLENWATDPERLSFSADQCSVTLSEDGSFYTIKSTVRNDNVVNLKFIKEAPGFVVGKNGTTEFGADLKNPWGYMRHAFWPRCRVEGSFVTTDGPLDMTGKGLFIHGLQGMKPHHAAARWNFVNFQSPTYSAIMMEFTTPPSYGSTVVNVGAIAVKDKILFAGTSNSASHTEVENDPECNWPEPKSASFVWNGKSADGKNMKAELTGPLGTRMDRIDIMAEVPKFVKQIVAGSVGTRPYIYQYGAKPTLKVTTDGETVEEDGRLFMEATFITPG